MGFFSFHLIKNEQIFSLIFTNFFNSMDMYSLYPAGSTVVSYLEQESLISCGD